jgi:glycosyltransferase involved in cell wall biosynthesis
MMPFAKISIVTPSYNQAEFLEEALLSVHDQNYPNIEHIVIDGASRDRSVSMLREYSGKPGWQHLRWVSESDEGQSDALNKGFKMASGDIVGWLNSDDLYRPGCFDKVSRAFMSRPNVDVFYGDYTWIDEKGRVFQIRREIEFNLFVLLYHRTLCVPSPSSFFKRRIFDEGNLIDPTYHYSMDWEFSLRLARQGYRFQHLPELLADFRWQPDSKTSKHVDRQCQDRDRIVGEYSVVLKKVPRAARPFCLAALRIGAASRYWSEKLLRGYYFSQWSPA